VPSISHIDARRLNLEGRPWSWKIEGRFLTSIF